MGFDSAPLNNIKGFSVSEKAWIAHKYVFFSEFVAQSHLNIYLAR